MSASEMNATINLEAENQHNGGDEAGFDYSNQDLLEALSDVQEDLGCIRFSSYYESFDDIPFLREGFLLSAVIVSYLHMNPEAEIPDLDTEVHLVRMSSANILALLDADDAEDDDNVYRRLALSITLHGLRNTLNRVFDSFGAENHTESL